MAGRIDEIQLVGLAVARLVRQRHGLSLDGDAALALDRVVVEDLRFHFALGQAATQLDDAIGQGRLTVVDVGNDGEVADEFHGAPWSRSPRSRRERRAPTWGRRESRSIAWKAGRRRTTAGFALSAHWVR